MKCFPVSGINLLVTWSVILMPLTGLGQIFRTNDVATWLSNREITWSGQTNGFWTGVYRPIGVPNSINVAILSTNRADVDNMFLYVLPPTDTFERLELRDTNGVLVPPDKKAKGSLPYRIPASNMPHSSDGIYSGHGTVYQYFFIGSHYPGVFNEIAVNNIYHVKQEGDYTLSVCPIIYRFETNREYLDRVDWPCVSINIHLQPQE